MLDRIDKTVQATQDITDLAAYYLREAGIAVAIRFVDNAELAFQRLVQMPKIGALLEFAQPAFAGIRRWHVHGFPKLLILYRERDGGIQIIRLLSAARDIDAIFAGSDASPF
jgi:toxin ParE1/3/4